MFFLFRNFVLELFVLRVRFKQTFLNILTFTSELWLRVFEYRVLRKLFGSERSELRGQWKRLHNKDLYDLYSPNIFFRVIKSGGLRWTGMQHVWRMREMHTGFW